MKGNINNKLESLLNNALEIDFNKTKKILILSDFHIGNRKSRDDFLKNSKLCFYIMNKYYDEGYTLILNGDIEELYRVKYSTIKEKWQDLYNLFLKFENDNRFFKIIGNHDYDLIAHEHDNVNRKLYESVKFKYNDNYILVFHGHQASKYVTRLSSFSSFILKYIANPLRIKNITRSYYNDKIFKIEKHVYDFSSKNKIVSIIGHTHRALFEALSEFDMLKYKIEHLLRIYPEVNEIDKSKIKASLKLYREELKILHEESNEYQLKGSLYDRDIVMPLIFNSGCVIGKRGANGIVIENESIYLMQWFTEEQKKKFYKYQEVAAKKIDNSKYYKMILKSDQLEYIFNRINFLS